MHRLARILRSPFALLLTAALMVAPGAALASETPAQAEVRCADAGSFLGLAKRSESESCWAELRPRPSSGRSGEEIFCVPRAEWQRRLASSEGGALCGEWRGRWKLVSPLSNDPPGSARADKTTIGIFRVGDFPRASPSRLDRARIFVERAREDIDRWLGPRDPTGILRELATGASPSDGPAGVLSLLGFVHLLWVSGVHLYALARLWDWALKRAFCACSSLPLGWARTLSATCTALTWVAAWSLAGARPAMLRPWLIVGLRRGARGLGFRWRQFAPLAIAIGLDAALGAWRGDLHDPSRWIYALACAGALLARSAPHMAGIAIRGWAMAAIFQTWRSGVLSLATPLLSVFCVPVFAGVLYPSLLVACALKETGLTGAADAIADVCGKAATFCVSGLAALALRGHWIGCLGPWAMLAGAAIAAFTLRARPPLRFALLGALACLRAGATLLPQDAQAGHEPFARRVEQLDVGQGDAALVVTGTRGEPSFGLIDSGSARALGDRAWIELLARRGAARLEWIALTHLDEDHSGGVKRLGRLVQIGCVATSRGELESPRGQTYKQDLESLGIRLTDWSGGCVPFPTLAPPERSRPGARNQNMGAIFIPLGPRGAEGFYLSAGDAEARDEPRIGAWAAALAARSDIRVPPAERILKISHHGSKTSSNPVFIRELAPTRAWISVGVGNRYGHPSASVLRELDELRIPYTRTDEKGALCAGRCGWLAPWRDD